MIDFTNRTLRCALLSLCLTVSALLTSPCSAFALAEKNDVIGHIEPQDQQRVFPSAQQVKNRLWEELQLAIADGIVIAPPFEQQGYEQWWNEHQMSHAGISQANLEQMALKCFALIEPQFRVPVVRTSEQALQLTKQELPGVLANWPFAENQWRASQVQHLTRFRQYELALSIATSLQPEQVLEPIGYLFSRAVCEHHLRLQSEAMNTISLLLLSPEELPVRYRAVSELMLEDLKQMEPESLDEISRMMNDVERRLDLGNTGNDTQKLEQEIVETLDKLIEDLEQQLAQAQSQSSSSSSQAMAPMDDSRVKGNTAPGNVEEKELIQRDGWGDLPPKDRAKAQQVLKNLFPPRYQKAIQEYNRKAAQRQ